MAEILILTAFLVLAVCIAGAAGRYESNAQRRLRDEMKAAARKYCGEE